MRTLIVVPTYFEVESIGELLHRLISAVPSADVIVVGAGAAGSVAAARLAEELPEGRKVMLLEAGQP
ncbi:MAG: NAD(P)-binding protein, partial [Ilumatobacteraceae bacterium]